MNTLNECDYDNIINNNNKNINIKKRCENIKTRIIRLEKRKIYEKELRRKRLYEYNKNNIHKLTIIGDNIIYSSEF